MLHITSLSKEREFRLCDLLGIWMFWASGGLLWSRDVIWKTGWRGLLSE